MRGTGPIVHMAEETKVVVAFIGLATKGYRRGADGKPFSYWTDRVKEGL